MRAYWHGEVVYGDTDSLFIHFPGKTPHEAMRLGRQICHEITALSPPYVVLKVSGSSTGGW